ncbi:MAG: hypothetical protein GXY61_13770 [Lentisphaerae bacterium]|jgi:hypothetical protein|nr:hypothetical protein [Lentisphaerota bacterium]
MLTTDIIGDQLATPNTDNWMNADSFEYLNKLPEEFRKRILALKDGDNARKAIDIGFDIYKWDNDM